MINLLPEPQTRAIQLDYYVRLAALALMLCALIAIAGVLLLLPSYFLASRELESAKVHTDATQKLLALHRETPATAQLSQTAEEVKLLQEGIARPSLMPLLGEIIAARSSVSLTGIFVDVPKEPGAQAGLRIIGVAPSRESLLAFLTRLRALPDVADADVPVSDLISGANVPFSVTAHWKRPPAQ